MAIASDILFPARVAKINELAHVVFEASQEIYGTSLELATCMGKEALYASEQAIDLWNTFGVYAAFMEQLALVPQTPELAKNDFERVDFPKVLRTGLYVGYPKAAPELALHFKRSNSLASTHPNYTRIEHFSVENPIIVGDESKSANFYSVEDLVQTHSAHLRGAWNK